jgi:hypothetical protein
MLSEPGNVHNAVAKGVDLRFGFVREPLDRD